MTPELSIVLPCYNEAAGLAALVARFHESGRGVPYELILVDNGSRDATPDVLRDLVGRYGFVRTLRVEVNQGYGHGIWTGLQAARGEALAWSHADLQTDPADVFRAWEIYRQSPRPARTLVKGRRRGRALQERVVTWGMQSLATVLLRTPMYEINAQPKLFHRELLGALASPPVDLNFDLYVLYAAKRCGWRVATFPVEFPPRQHGQSSWATSWRSKARTISRSARYIARLARAPRPRLAAPLAVESPMSPAADRPAA
jgi:glycosyltransferase involved in cell wall biosynthesis